MSLRCIAVVRLIRDTIGGWELMVLSMAMHSVVTVNQLDFMLFGDQRVVFELCAMGFGN
jgi:hypothetical protein